MTGDGLTDLVQVHPGSVRYWPNLGYGRFGEAIQMANSPRLEGPVLFDPARVRLVDVDGSGAADLVYLGREAAGAAREGSCGTRTPAATGSGPAASCPACRPLPIWTGSR